MFNFIVGTVVVLFAVAFIVGMIQGILEGVRGKAGGGRGVVELNPMEHGFRGRVRVDNARLDDGSEIEVFDFQIKGVIVGDREQWSGMVRVGVVDVTESKEGGLPVLCAIDELQRPETCIFEYVSQPQGFQGVAWIENWMTVFKVPIDALQFARRGRRKLCFFFGVCEADYNQTVHTYDEVEFEFDVREPGYIDLDNIQREIDQMTVKLAVIVSAADGVLDPTEGAIVQSWIRKRLSVENDQQRAAQIKSELNLAVQQGSSLGSGDIAPLCQTIVKKGATAHRYDALELCLEVAGADGSAEKAELDTIAEIARHLEIDAARLKDMVQKALPVGMFAEKDPDSVLGIEGGMSRDEIKSLLSDEYRKWNARASHSDKKVREQASEMLALIADARKRHIG